MLADVSTPGGLRRCSVLTLALTIGGCVAPASLSTPERSGAALAVKPGPSMPPAEQRDPVVELSLGPLASCGIHRSGEVSCRGVAIGGISSPPVRDLVALDVGRSTACGLGSDGRIRCWWHDGSAEPKSIDTPGDVLQFARVDSHSPLCALDHEGALTCQSLAGPSRPVRVPGIADAVAVVAGRSQLCALHRSGRVSCWAADDDRVVPRAPSIHTIPDLSDARTITAGDDRLCALTATGSLRCWRLDDDGTLPMRADDIPQLPPMTGVAVGQGFVCGSTADGSVHCAGLPHRNAPAWTQNRATQRVPGLPAVVKLFGGPRQVCARAHDDSIWCWGADDGGQFGDGIPTDAAAASGSHRLAGVMALALSGDASCALLRDGTVLCWGGRGALAEPTVFGHIPGAVELDFKLGTLCIRTIRGEVACREVDESTARRLPGKAVEPAWRPPFPRLHDATSVTIGLDRVCALAVGGPIRCGSMAARDHDFEGHVVEGGVTVETSFSATFYVRTADGKVRQLGAPMASIDPTRLTEVESIALGGVHLCALSRAGTVECLGDDQSGQLGVPRLRARSPQVEGRYTMIAADGLRTCAITQPDREVMCWGQPWSDAGLGFYPHVRRRVALDRPALTLALGFFHACAYLEGDEVVCWGESDEQNQLGHPRAAPPQARRFPASIRR